MVGVKVCHAIIEIVWFVNILDLAYLYATYANDWENGTHDAPTFADAANRHKLSDLISEASSTGKRQTVNSGKPL